jgi:hypothetical protein
LPEQLLFCREQTVPRLEARTRTVVVVCLQGHTYLYPVRYRLSFGATITTTTTYYTWCGPRTRSTCPITDTATVAITITVTVTVTDTDTDIDTDIIAVVWDDETCACGGNGIVYLAAVLLQQGMGTWTRARLRSWRGGIRAMSLSSGITPRREDLGYKVHVLLQGLCRTACRSKPLSHGVAKARRQNPSARVREGA